MWNINIDETQSHQKLSILTQNGHFHRVSVSTYRNTAKVYAVTHRYWDFHTRFTRNHRFLSNMWNINIDETRSHQKLSILTQNGHFHWVSASTYRNTAKVYAVTYRYWDFHTRNHRFLSNMWNINIDETQSHQNYRFWHKTVISSSLGVHLQKYR
jgi:hypothetical protein